MCLRVQGHDAVKLPGLLVEVRGSTKHGLRVANHFENEVVREHGQILVGRRVLPGLQKTNLGNTVCNYAHSSSSSAN